MASYTTFEEWWAMYSRNRTYASPAEQLAAEETAKVAWYCAVRTMTSILTVQNLSIDPPQVHRTMNMMCK